MLIHFTCQLAFKFNACLVLDHTHKDIPCFIYQSASDLPRIAIAAATRQNGWAITSVSYNGTIVHVKKDSHVSDPGLTTAKRVL